MPLFRFGPLIEPSPHRTTSVGNARTRRQAGPGHNTTRLRRGRIGGSFLVVTESLACAVAMTTPAIALWRPLVGGRESVTRWHIIPPDRAQFLSSVFEPSAA